MKLNFSHSGVFHTNTKVCLIYLARIVDNVEDNELIKKTVYDKWVTKVNSIKVPDTTGLRGGCRGLPLLPMQLPRNGSH